MCISAIQDEILRLNNLFHNYKLVTPEFYRQLTNYGFIISKCFIVELIPDGTNTYTGQIISQEGKLLEFDIDLDYDTLSTFEDVTNHFKTGQKSPKSRVVIAYTLFKQLTESLS